MKSLWCTGTSISSVTFCLLVFLSFFFIAEIPKTECLSLNLFSSICYYEVAWPVQFVKNIKVAVAEIIFPKKSVFFTYGQKITEKVMWNNTNESDNFL